MEWQISPLFWPVGDFFPIDEEWSQIDIPLPPFLDEGLPFATEPAHSDFPHFFLLPDELYVYEICPVCNEEVEISDHYRMLIDGYGKMCNSCHGSTKRRRLH